jgi:HK97 gp10 family phage protein
MARIIGVPKPTIGLPSRGAASGGVTANVKIIGVEQLIAKLGLVANVARLELGLETRGAALRMYQMAQANVPVITGNLKSGISVEHMGPYSWAVTASSLAGNISPKNQKEYAAWVEFGTSKMRGRHFMTTAYQETAPIVAADLKLIAAKLERL